jgi:preprotein translocase subunit SecG
MTVLLVVLYVLICLFLVMVVLLQQGKGADLAGAFGGGGSQASFGPRSATNIMHRLTTVSFVLFVVLSLTLAILSGKRRASVMEGLDASEPAAVTVPVEDAAPAGDAVGAVPEDETTPTEGAVPTTEDEGTATDEPPAEPPAE